MEKEMADDTTGKGPTFTDILRMIMVLGVQSRHLMGWVEFESFGL